MERAGGAWEIKKVWDQTNGGNRNLQGSGQVSGQSNGNLVYYGNGNSNVNSNNNIVGSNVNVNNEYGYATDRSIV